jgi:histidyl-tRNA synthetase
MKKNFVKPTLPRGTRDFLPEQMLRREYIIETIERVFKKYSFEPLQTPAIEKLEVLTGKYGEEGEQLIFKILRRGTGLEKVGKPDGLLEMTIKDFNKVVDFALRYDLTVPLCRVVAMYQNELIFPFKRYQIQPVWRADKPQKGRYREFYQCDVDAVGSDSMLVDAEIIAIINDILSTLGFEEFKIRINNRKILTGIVEYSGADESLANSICMTIDKFEKIGLEGVKKELEAKEVSKDSINRIIDVLEISGDNNRILSDVENLLAKSEIGSEGVDETKELVGYVRELGIPEKKIHVDLYLARGLTYYTGPIYESIVEKPNIGSLTGGGRFDKLVGMFLGRDIPATGTTIGIERIIDVMAELNMIPPAKTSTQVLVTIFDESTKRTSIETVTQLRNANINSELYLKARDGLGVQLKYADRKGIPLTVIIGPDEINAGTAVVKDLRANAQESVGRDKLIEVIKQKLNLSFKPRH